MNTRYDSLLTDWMIKLNLLKEKSFYNKDLLPGINCHCKEVILNNYLISIKNLVIPIISLVQLTKYQSDKNLLECYFKKIEEFHKDECFKFLYYKENLSHKILFIFETIHLMLFKLSMEEIKTTMMDFVGYKYEEEYVLVNWLCQILYDLLEIGILTLSGLRINSFNISVSIFEHEYFSYNVKDMRVFDTKDIENCDYNCKDFCYEKEQEIICKEDGSFKEELHLFLVPEYYKSPYFLDKYFEIIFNYHCLPSNIDIIVDYQLMDELIWSENEYRRLNYLKNTVKSIKIINYDNVDFNKYYKEVKEFLN